MRRHVSALVLLTAGMGAVATLALAGGASPATSGPARLSTEWRDRLIGAVAAYRSGDWKTAAREFGEASQATTPIPEYALYFQSLSLAGLPDVPASRTAAVHAVERAGDGPLLGPALLQAAQQSAQVGDQGAAALYYRRFIERFPEHPEGPRARYALAQALEASGLAAEAQRAYRAIILIAPASPVADSAALQQRALSERGITSPPLGPRERLDRIERLLAGGRVAAARTEAEALLADGPTVDVTLRAWRVVAEGWRRAGRADESLRAVDRALAVAPADRRAPWLLERARLLQPRAREQALAALAQIVRDHPRSLEAADALLLRGQILEAVPALAEAEAAYVRLVSDYPDDEDAGTALWRLGWLAWFRGAHQEAVRRWGRLSTVRGGQRLRDAATYWTGRAHEVRGDVEAAGRQLTTLVASVPRSYYGILAANRLGRDAPAVARDAAGPGPALPADALDPVRGDERYVKAEALRAVGLASFADNEVEDLGRRAAGDPARLYAVSAAHVEGARYHLALRILRREFLALARGGHAALPRAFWEMFYPLGWRSELVGAAGRAALDPFFVAAVVREESSYDPQARSRVGARGLMQLMPETARPMAKSRGLAFQDGGLLDEPGPNIELGSAFIAGLVKEFRDPRLAVAAYNAGPRRVREWWAARRSDDVEEWVEQIPFNETRNFVKRVMLAWEEYRRLYAQP